MHIAFLHTADVHIATFEALFHDLGSDAVLTHEVAADLLASARTGGIESVRQATTDRLTALEAADAVVCTCSTLGPIVDDVARHAPHVVRIDRPLMEAAVACGGTSLIVLCLQSTAQPSLHLFEDCAKASGSDAIGDVLLCEDAWPLFEAGRIEAFGRSIAQHVKARVAAGSSPSAIVLGQASMRAAEPFLTDIALPVLSSPRLAAERAIAVATKRLAAPST